MDILLLRLEAPLMSFGGPIVDNHGFTQPYPGRALLTGLIGNALGYCHGNAESLQALQRRIRHAVRCDRRGVAVVDYQTVDLSQPFLAQGWTTSGIPEGREGGDAKSGTHIRYRHYLADASYLVALTVSEPAAAPTLDEIEVALVEPARPLFIGRKTCLPTRTIRENRVNAETLLEALMPGREQGTTAHSAWWPADEHPQRKDARLVSTTDERDWLNQIHVGRRWMYEGTIDA